MESLTEIVIPVSSTDLVLLLDQEGGIKAHGRLEDLQMLNLEALTIECVTLEADSDITQKVLTGDDTETTTVERGHVNDAAVLRYYLRSVGVTSLVAFLVLAVSFAFLSVFPSK